MTGEGRRASSPVGWQRWVKVCGEAVCMCSKDGHFNIRSSTTKSNADIHVWKSWGVSPQWLFLQFLFGRGGRMDFQNSQYNVLNHPTKSIGDRKRENKTLSKSGETAVWSLIWKYSEWLIQSVLRDKHCPTRIWRDYSRNSVAPIPT